MSRVRVNGNSCEFRCPGCGQLHILAIGEHGQHPKWNFTGSAESPTLAPSILARGMLCVFDDHGEWTGEWQRDSEGRPIPYVCHSFVRAGHIEFLNDCTHAMAGQTVELPVLAEGVHCD